MSNSGKKDIVVGLDIGTTKIVCMVGSKNEFGKIEILGMGKSESVGVSRGVVSNIDKTVESIKTAVAEAEAQSGVNIRVVNVGIAGQHIKSLQHRGEKIRHTGEDEIDQKDIDGLIDDMYKLVTLPGEEIIHVLPQEYIVDNEQGLSVIEAIRVRNFNYKTAGEIAKASPELADLDLEQIAVNKRCIPNSNAYGYSHKSKR